MQAVHLYEFGEFQLDATERCLLRAGEPVALTPKAFDTLLLLVSRSGHIVEKDELLKEVWPDAFVEEATVAQNIFTLRKALGQAQNGHRFIETVPKRGYRFVAGVREVRDSDSVLVVEKHTRTEIVTEEEEVEAASGNGASRPSRGAGAGANGWATVFSNQGAAANAVEPTATTPEALALAKPEAAGMPQTVTKRPRSLRLYLPLGLALLIGAALAIYFWQSRNAKQRETNLVVKSIAVLPFKALDADSGNELLGLGMADAIIIRLSKFQRLPVLPTSAIIKYTGRDNDPWALGQALGVDAVLNGTVQRSGDRVRVTVQLISLNTAKTLWSDKFDEQFTSIFAVQDSISERVAQALALQLTGEQRKQLAKRYTGNTEAYQDYVMGLYFYNKRTKDGLEKAVEYFRRAIEKDQNYALAHALLADTYYLLVYYRYAAPRNSEISAKAKAAAIRALELDDTLAEAHTAMATILSDVDRDRAGAEREHKRAIELNPNYAIAHLRYAWFLSVNGPMDEVVREMRRAQELDPLSPTTNGALAGALLLARQYDESIKYSQRALELDPESFINLLTLGDAYRMKRMFDQAIVEYQKALELNIDNMEPLSGLALAYAQSGRKAEAEKVLAKLQEMAGNGSDVFYSIALIYGALGDKARAFEWLEKAIVSRAMPSRSLRFDPDLDVLKAEPGFDELLKRHNVEK
ncbi:MAG TPA: winged helix-turn-helix domain-containing protein [Pyrinomonadaceae bacterium]|jgi:DNA-binding winged helix-turn-helix (wHTH) protein/TolB-like protein/Tfp pilus assembly protein PilF